MLSKRNILSVLLIAVVSLTLLFGANNVNASVSDEFSQGMELISDVTQNKYGTVLPVKEDTGYQELFEENLVEFNDDNYVYLLTEDAGNTKAILLSQKPGEPLFDFIGSASQAEEYAVTIADNACPGFFEREYDVFTKESGEEDYISYTVELWEKIEDDFYTGNKIAVILTSDGYLDSLVSRGSKISESRLTEPDFIDENSAVNAAYNAVESVVENVEKNQLSTGGSSEIKLEPDDDSVISDAYLSEEPSSDNTKAIKEDYDIRIEDREDHTLNAYKEYSQGNIEWVVTILDVQTNREWGSMSYLVKINAETGGVDFVNSTR